MKRLLSLAAAIILVGAAAPALAQDKQSELLNASYDVARELFAEINPAFTADWKTKTGESIEVKQSHGGSSRQARAVAEGLQADVVTFNQVTDIQFLVGKGYVAADWQDRLPNKASPFYSFPAFLVRKGNPKAVKDWNDLVRADVKSIFPNPKTSGNARYTYLAAYAYALEQNKGDDAKAKAFVKTLLANVPVFDTGGRAATTTFVERKLGDVLITFESEVNGIKREYGDDGYEVVIPSVSLLGEFPVAVVDKVAEKRGTLKQAQGYLQFLYSEAGQTILAQNFNRVHDPKVSAAFKAQFPNVRLVKVEDVFGAWDKVGKEHFASGGVLEELLVNR